MPINKKRLAKRRRQREYEDAALRACLTKCGRIARLAHRWYVVKTGRRGFLIATAGPFVFLRHAMEQVP
jgi:hypothetical protein